MKSAHIRRYLGLPVIVQLRDAMALATIPEPGPMQAAPVVNAKGEMLLKDGSVAPDNAKQEEIAFRPAWPIAVLRDPLGSPEFRYAISGAMVSLPKQEPDEEPLVLIHYTEGQTLYELAVVPESIVGITCVRQGPMPEEKSRLVHPGRN